MKNVLLFLAIWAPVWGWGQDKAEPLSEAEKISARAGVLVEKQFIEAGTVKVIKVEQLVVKNLSDQSTVKALRISAIKATQYTSDEKVSVLDSDEIDGLIISLKAILSLSGEKRDCYTEVTFKSRTGMKAGAYYDTKAAKWICFVGLGGLISNNFYLTVEDMGRFMELVEAAKSKM